MLPSTARRIAANARRLLTARLIHPADYAVLDALLWRVRRPGMWDCDPDYATLARLAGICRGRAIKAVRVLVSLGLITKTKRHALVRWGRNRAQVAARQLSNAYVFCAPQLSASSTTVELYDSCAPSKESSGRAADSDSKLDSGSTGLERALSRFKAAIQGECGASPGA